MLNLIPRVNWDYINNSLTVTKAVVKLGKAGVDAQRPSSEGEAGSPDRHLSLEQQTVLRAIDLMGAEFQRVLSPFSKFLLVAFAIMFPAIAGAIAVGSFLIVGPWPGVGISITVLSSMALLTRQLWTQVRQQTQMELLPSMYRFIYVLCRSESDYQFLTQHMLTTVEWMQHRGNSAPPSIPRPSIPQHIPGGDPQPVPTVSTEVSICAASSSSSQSAVSSTDSGVQASGHHES